MVFKYQVGLESGGRERGIVTADDREEAGRILRERRLTILSLEEVGSPVTDSPDFDLAERSPQERALAPFAVSSARLELALEQLAAMLEGGVPILDALQTVAAQSGRLLSRALFCVANRLRAGRSLTESLREEMPFLGNITIGLISAGEANGDVDRMCTYAAELMARRRKLKGQVMQAMAYPALVILATIGVVAFLMAKVIPRIMKFLGGRSAGLPPVTQALVDATRFLEANGPCLLAAPLAAAVCLALLRRNREMAVHVDHAALRLPVFGKVLRASSNMLWCRTLGILLRSGINILPALDFTAAALDNRFYRTGIQEMKRIVAQGQPLSTALRVSGLKPFVPLADAMLVVGESTGRMDSGLLKVADFCDADLQRRVAVLAKMIEPALFVVVGGIVGFVYIAFFMGLMAASTGR